MRIGTPTPKKKVKNKTIDNVKKSSTSKNYFYLTLTGKKMFK